MSRAVIHVSASQAAEADVLGLSPPGRTHVIVNGVDAAAVAALVSRRSPTRAELGIRDDALLLATVARFDPIKALDVLLRALPLIAERLPPAQFLVVGDGPERDRLHTLARALGLGGRVVFTGLVPDAVRLVALADLYVTASRREGMPLAVLEAMACGMPVLATRVPGHTDVVQDGVTGALVPPDDPGALAAAAVRLLTDRARLAVLGQAGRKRVLEDFDHARMVRQVADVYRASAGRRPA